MATRSATSSASSPATMSVEPRSDRPAVRGVVVGMGGGDVPQRRLGLDAHEVEVVVDGVESARVSATCQTTIAAISTGLPSASLTFRWLVSKFRTRMLTVRRSVSGRTQQKPLRRTVPT